MLFLKRKEMQDVVVTAPDGQMVRFRITHANLWQGRFSSVNVGIDAPHDWKINREEIVQPRRAVPAVINVRRRDIALGRRKS